MSQYEKKYHVVLYLIGKDIGTPATTKTFRFSERGFHDGAEYMLPCLSSGILFSENGSGGSPMDIRLINVQDSLIEEMRDYNFSGNNYQIWLYEPAADDWTRIHKATIDTVLVRDKDVVVKTRDHYQSMNVEINPKFFAGDATTYEGAAELKEVIKPRVLGAPDNITPYLLNEAKHLYGCNWDSSGNRIAIDDFYEVRDQGVPITFGTYHGTEAALLAATVNSGEVDVCISKSLFRLGSNPNGLVTCTPYQASSDDYTDFIDTMATACSLGTVTYLNESNIATLLKSHYFTTLTTWLDAFRALIQDTGMVYYFDRAGALVVGMPRTSDAVRATFSDGVLQDEEIPILSIDIEKVPPPPTEFAIKYAQMFTQQGPDEVAGSVSPPDAWAYPFKTYVDDNSANTGAYPLAKREELDVLLDNRGGAINIGTWVSEFRGAQQDGIVLTVPLFYPTGVTDATNGDGLTGTPPVSTSDLAVGSNVYIKTSKFNISASQKFRVMSYTMNTAERIATYHLMGDRP